jgi:hypothetical protein
MTITHNADPESPGQALLNELLWVHDKIRHDLNVVHELSLSIRNGAPASEVQAEIDRLETNSPLWRLRVNCLYYCRFVHMHHTIEDVALFPELRRTNPELNPVVDRLESDHRKVSDYLDDISAVTKELGRNDTPENRKRLIDGLDELSTLLLAHLEYEEIEISPALLQWTQWPHP